MQMHTSVEYTISFIGEVTVKLLDQELQEVSDWFGLGLHLDIPPDELHTIKYEPTLASIFQRCSLRELPLYACLHYLS